jgi:predicted phosphodiesterase
MNQAVHLFAINGELDTGKLSSAWALLFFVLFPFFSLAQQAAPAPSCHLDFIADTQAPLWFEDIYLTSNRNTEATRILMNDILIQKPAALFHLGDVVSLSSSNRQWEFMDSCLASLRAAGLPAYACLGNHELMGNARVGEKNFQVRFPDHVNTGYVVRIDSLAMVFLNSNFSKMLSGQILAQDEWYRKEVAALELDPGIRVVIVGCHHSPFSDSKMVGSSILVQEKFVPAFIKSRKCKVFVSGHAHLFQHFIFQGKNFLVIGGGGGLQHPLKNRSCGLQDISGDYKPSFHYLTLSRYTNHLKIVSRQLKEDFSCVEDGLTFEIGISD